MEYKKQELIDTQWDVNINLDIQLNGSSDELIDTQWDVNLVEEEINDKLALKN